MRALAVLLALASPAMGQGVCADYDELKSLLAREHDERRVFEGAAKGGGALEVWTSGHMGTWTAVHVLEPMPGELIGCIIGTGLAAVVRMPGRSL